jgi:hypothetical protein
MTRAIAKQLTPENGSIVTRRKTKKVVLNLDKIRRFIRVGGIIILLTMGNASIQALVAKTQFRLEEVQSEMRTLDQRIGWCQCELAAQISQQQIHRLVLSEQETTDNMEQEAPSQGQVATQLVLPPSILNLDVAPSPPGETVTTKIHHWWSGIGRTLAEGIRHK